MHADASSAKQVNKRRWHWNYSPEYRYSKSTQTFMLQLENEETRVLKERFILLEIKDNLFILALCKLPSTPRRDASLSTCHRYY